MEAKAGVAAARSPWTPSPSRSSGITSAAWAKERRDFGTGHQDHGLLFCWEDGRPVYPGTINDRFERLIREAGIPRITPHRGPAQLRNIALRSGVHPKIVSSRLWHATVAFTLDASSEDVPDLDREAAGIITGLFVREPLGQTEPLESETPDGPG